MQFKVEMLQTLRPRKGRATGINGEMMAVEVRVARWKHDKAEERLFWSDSDTVRLENQLPDTAVALVLTAERQYRKARQFSHEWDKRDFEERVEKTRQASEAAAARERDALAQAKLDRVDRLLAQVDASKGAANSRICW